MIAIEEKSGFTGEREYRATYRRQGKDVYTGPWMWSEIGARRAVVVEMELKTPEKYRALLELAISHGRRLIGSTALVARDALVSVMEDEP